MLEYIKNNPWKTITGIIMVLQGVILDDDGNVLFTKHFTVTQ